MSIKAKICGLTTLETVAAAREAGACYIGFVFFDKSPRNITAQKAAELAAQIPSSIIKTGVFVNPTDNDLQNILDQVSLDLIQLHGGESPARVQEIKNRFRRPVMKAIPVQAANDLLLAKTYEPVADMLLFDAKAPASLHDALPGGNGLSFDWTLIKDTTWQIPWMLSGGLTAGNITDALDQSRAKIVDVSSGIEVAPGEKNIQKIDAFMKAVREYRDDE